MHSLSLRRSLFSSSSSRLSSGATLRLPALAPALALLAAAGSAQGTRFGLLGDVADDFAFSPDGGTLVFRADAFHEGCVELFAGPADASAPARRLSAPLARGGDVTAFAVGAGRVAYIADQEEDEVYALYSVPIEGGAVVPLSGSLVVGGDVASMRLTPDGTQVIYLADALVDTRREFFHVPIDGSAAPVALDPAPIHLPIPSYWIHPAGTCLFYTQRDIVIGPPFGLPQFRETLYVLGLGGSPNRLALASAHFSNDPFNQAQGCFFLDLQVHPDGGHVLYTDAIYGKDGLTETMLNCAAIDGSETPIVLTNGAHNIDFSFLVSAGGRVVFEELSDIYSIRIDGTDRRNLDVNGWRAQIPFALSPEGSEVFFYSSLFQSGVLMGGLFRSPIDGSQPASALDQARDLYVRELVVDDTHASYLTRIGSSFTTFRGLYAVPRDGSLPPVLLNGPPVDRWGADTLSVAPGARVLYRNTDPAFDFELFVAACDGSVPSRRLCGRMSGGRDMLAYRLSPNGEDVAYTADQRVDGTSELLATTLSGARPVPMITGLCLR